MKGVAFRRAEPADAPRIAQLLADPLVYPNTLQLPLPATEPMRQGLEARAKDAQYFNVLAIHGDDVIGNAGLHPVTPSLRQRHVAGLFICVAPAWWGKGVGAELMRRLLDWADNWAGLLRIELGVYPDNAPALALYRRFGFVEEGVQRANSLRNGEYVDTLLMARFHPNPPKLPPATRTQ